MRIDTIATDIKVTTIQPGIVETDFSQVRVHGDKDKAAKVYQGLEALQAQDIADAVLYVTKQPRRVQISDMTIMQTNKPQGLPFIGRNKKSPINLFQMERLQNLVAYSYFCHV